jgi:hypothetical protein
MLPSVCHQQRREAFRVPVEPSDRITAGLFVPRDTNAYPLWVRNLSIKGIGVSLDNKYREVIGQAEGLHATLELVFEKSDENFRTTVNIVSVVNLTDFRIGVGMQWLDPTTEFSNYLRCFLIQKESALLKRRSGLHGG